MSTFDQPLPDVEVNVPAPADFSTALAEGFARRVSALAQRGGASEEGVRWAARAAFAVSRATSEGHVCVPLDELAQRYDAEAAHVREALLASGVASGGRQRAHALRPLVVDGQGRLYLARYYDYERRLAQSLVGHARGERDAAVSAGLSPQDSPSGLRDRLLRYFGEPRDAQIDWQRVAAVMALSGRLTIVSGGPGTGKTTTVVGVLACLLDARADLRIALAAPTGKAAQRMQEALLARASSLPPELAARLPQTSFTLHRLLGTGPNGRFRHHRDNPLPYDVIVIDEASMIDVAMATHLFDALAGDTHLVMLGDKDQLAAVEAGAVFAELSAQPAFTASGVGAIAAALGIDERRLRDALPTGQDDTSPEQPQPFIDDLFGMPPATQSQQSQQSQPAPLADCVVWLERNYRFGLESAIGRLSLAIRRGAAPEALDVLAIDPVEPCAAAFHQDADAAPSERTIQRLAAGFAPYAEALATALADSAGATSHALSLFDALNRFRILCATRLGSRGVEQMNAAMAAQVRRIARVPLAIGAQWFAGRPIMVTRNDYALGLFNGDIGIALPGADGTLRVLFRGADGSLRAVSPAALPPHDTAFALTVHKSQGSEFDHAVLMLPSTFSRVLSRELVYTAVTRARERVEVVGSRAVLMRAIATPTQRDSGLAARIAEAMQDAGGEAD